MKDIYWTKYRALLASIAPFLIHVDEINLEERLFYLQKIIENQWSSRVLEYHHAKTLQKHLDKEHHV